MLKDHQARPLTPFRRKYLISSFPALKQVGYTILPDTVWRPLVLGAVFSSQNSVVLECISLWCRRGAESHFHCS